MNLTEYFETGPFELPGEVKEACLLRDIRELTRHHMQKCQAYNRIVETMFGSSEFSSIEEAPYLPIGLFKSHRLLSVPEEEVFTVLNSSGTTGQQLSKIYLDKPTAHNQARALAHILKSVLGPQRLPMLIVDAEANLRLRNARSAGILGIMNMGRQHLFALRDDMTLDEESVGGFLKKHGGAPFVVFGFTFMIWQFLFKALQGANVDMSNGILLHSGGWKGLESERVSNLEFKRSLNEAMMLRRIYNFYGMVEQTGSIFLEGDDGFLHSPSFAEVIVRNPANFEVLETGQAGLIQLVSVLPWSYPGHSVLTQDIGIVDGGVESSGRRSGQRLTVLGRASKAELRGCSDVQAALSTALVNPL